MRNSEKRYIPGTNPSWGVELPDEYSNSLVSKDGRNRDDGYNFDERDSETIPDDELANYAKDQIVYAGLFFDPEEIYSQFPQQRLAHRIRDPHVTTAYRPGVDKLFLNHLGSDAIIRVVGYGNDGQNEGLLVEIVAAPQIIKKTLEEQVIPDGAGGYKPFPTHITLSIAEGAKAVNTRNLKFKRLETPVYFTGIYKFFGKNGTLISDEDTIREMYKSKPSTEEIEDADRP